MTTHYHHGHGLTGYGPEEPDRCVTLSCLADCVRTQLDMITDAWGDQAHGERYHIEQLLKMRPTNGGDPMGYEGSWESIATAALRALECLDNAGDVETLAMNLRPERRDAPMYRGNPEAWSAELSRLLLHSGTYPLDTDISGGHRFYVWQCSEWACLLNEHDAGYEVPAASTSGGYVPCACLTCPEILVWSPGSGEAPYCVGCADEGCADRECRECDNSDE